MAAGLTSADKRTGVNSARGWPGYNTIWRWHFYAGLMCLPFILWLPVTGAIYLFKPQIEAWLDQPYEQLTVTGARAEPAAHVTAALAAVPGAVLNSYLLPDTPHSAVRVLVGKDEELTRVYVHPETLEILKQEREDRRLMRVLFHLHGELMLGSPGSMVVELAASWTIIMILTGLTLWWPRNAQGLAGILYPRLGRSGRTVWRDLHAVTGLWGVVLRALLADLRFAVGEILGQHIERHPPAGQHHRCQAGLGDGPRVGDCRACGDEYAGRRAAGTRASQSRACRDPAGAAQARLQHCESTGRRDAAVATGGAGADFTTVEAFARLDRTVGCAEPHVARQAGVRRCKRCH